MDLTRATPLTALKAKKDKKEEDDKEEKRKSSGIFSRFASSSDKNEKDTKVTEEKEEAGGIMRSITKRFESRQEIRDAKNNARKDAKLAEILEKESKLSGAPSYLPKFSTSGVSSAFRNASASLNLARDEIRSVRAGKRSLTEEEQKLEDLRRRTEAQKRKRIIAQQLADQRTVDRRKKQLEERKAKTTKEAESKYEDVGGKGEGGVDSGKRSNPLSVAQAFFSNWFEGQKDEEWLVVAPKTRISPGEMVPVTAAGLDLLLVASKDGSALYCIENSCPHLGTPLEVGVLERRPIETSGNSTSNDASNVDPSLLQEKDITKLLTQDGCEDCIVCPLHKTAFALESGEVRGEWCPYPPVIGKVMGTVKTKSTLPVFDVRTKGKNIEVRLNTPFKVEDGDDD